GEAAVLPLHAAVVLFFLLFFDFALAVHSEGVALDADVDVFLVDSGHFDLERDLVLVFVDVDGGGEARSGQSIIAVCASVGFAERAVDAVLQGGELTEGLPAGKYGHGKSSFRIFGDSEIS